MLDIERSVRLFEKSIYFLFSIVLCCNTILSNVIFSHAETSDYDLVEEIINEMTADEFFIVFGSSGGALTEEATFTAEQIAATLDMIRQDQDTDIIIDIPSAENAEDDNADFGLVGASSGMTTSQDGIELIKRLEGCRLTAYKALSTETYYTIGYGHHGSDVTEGMTITLEQAEALLVSDLKKFESYVNSYINNKGLKLNQNQFDALVSFTYNLGTQWMKGTNVPKMLTNGYERFDPQVVHDYFCEWSYSSHKFIQGLYNRREAESAMFLKPCYDMCSVTRVGLELGSQIGEIIYISLTDTVANDSNAYIRVIHGNSTTDYPIGGIKTDSNNCRLKVDLPIKDALDTITVYVYYSNGTKALLRNGNADNSYGYHFSVDEYEALVKLENDTTLLELISALKQYSKCAKAYFSQQDTTAYISADLTKDKLTSYGRTVSGIVDGINYEGITLLLKENTSVRVYFSLDSSHSIGEYTFTCNGQQLRTYCQNSIYYIDIANISAMDINTMYTVKVTNSKGKSMTVVVGALSYAYSVYNNDNVSLKGLMSKLYDYNIYAKKYFNN